MPSTPIPQGIAASFQQSQVADDDLRRLNKAMNATPRALRRRCIACVEKVHPSSQLVEEEEGEVGTSQKSVRIISDSVEGFEEVLYDTEPASCDDSSSLDEEEASEQRGQRYDQSTQATQRVMPNVLSNQTQSPLALRIHELMVAAKHGLWFLLEAVLLSPLRDTRLLDEDNVQYLRLVLVDILGSSNDYVIKSALSGNMSLDKIRSPELKMELDRLAVNEYRNPGIYLNELVSEAGVSPNPAELTLVIKRLRSYADQTADAKWVNQVDTFRYHKSQEESLGFFQKFVNTFTSPSLYWYLRDDKKHIVGKRVEIVHFFCDELEKRLTFEDPSEPLATPLKEVGYAKDLPSRLKDHRIHKGSNFLMNLTEAILRVELELQNVGIRYTIKQHVVYHCWHSEQCRVGEVLWTRLCNGYLDNGGGFSHHIAGQNNASGKKIEDRDWEEWYCRAQTPEFEMKCDMENEKVAQLHALEARAAELKKLVAEAEADLAEAELKVVQAQVAREEERLRVLDEFEARRPERQRLWAQLSQPVIFRGSDPAG